jgi:hypothetical protein
MDRHENECGSGNEKACEAPQEAHPEGPREKAHSEERGAECGQAKDNSLTRAETMARERPPRKTVSSALARFVVGQLHGCARRIGLSRSAAGESTCPAVTEWRSAPAGRSRCQHHPSASEQKAASTEKSALPNQRAAVKQMASADPVRPSAATHLTTPTVAECRTISSRTCRYLVDLIPLGCSELGHQRGDLSFRLVRTPADPPARKLIRDRHHGAAGVIPRLHVGRDDVVSPQLRTDREVPPETSPPSRQQPWLRLGCLGAPLREKVSKSLPDDF